MPCAGRRSSKLVSVLTSCFTANYVRWWGEAMGAERPLRQTPVFDGRAVCYPSAATLRDYLSWRQADCHINNQVGGLCGFVCGWVLAVTPHLVATSWCLQSHAVGGWQLVDSSAEHTHANTLLPHPQYNTPYWELVKAGAAPSEAQATLAGSDAAFKNELLFSRFGINYNELPEQFRKVRRRARAAARCQCYLLVQLSGARPG